MEQLSEADDEAAAILQRCALDEAVGIDSLSEQFANLLVQFRFQESFSIGTGALQRSSWPGTTWREAFGLPPSLRGVASHFFYERKQRILKHLGQKSDLPRAWQVTLAWQVTPDAWRTIRQQ